jgi:hypothetical protein
VRYLLQGRENWRIRRSRSGVGVCGLEGRPILLRVKMEDEETQEFMQEFYRECLGI